MRCITLLVTGLILCGCAQMPEVLTMREITTAEGWQGKAFYRNGILTSEELDTLGNDGRPDLWRYYESGLIVREDFDTSLNGVVDTVKHYDEKGILVKLMVDTNHDGSFDSVTIYDPRASAPASAAARSEGASTSTAPELQPRQADSGQADANRRLTLQDMFDSNNQSLSTQQRIDAQPPQDIPPVMPVRDEAIAPVAPTGVTPAGSGSIIQPIAPPAGQPTPSAPTRTGIVPGPIFHHPSESLGD